MKSKIINDEIFELIVPRKTVTPVTGYLACENDIFSFYKSPSLAKLEIWHSWIIWASECKNIKSFYISGHNCMQFTISGLIYINDEPYNIYITRDHNRLIKCNSGFQIFIQSVTPIAGYNENLGSQRYQVNTQHEREEKQRMTVLDYYLILAYFQKVEIRKHGKGRVYIGTVDLIPDLYMNNLIEYTYSKNDVIVILVYQIFIQPVTSQPAIMRT